jgi:hypothetical protein
MQCDGHCLWLTANVDVMLRHLRKAYDSRNLWIDALCIDQTDDLEKAEQVASMGAIYKWADKTHVWLGAATDHDQIPAVFAFLKQWAISGRAPKNSAAEFTTKSIEASVAAFFTRPWFTRRWVLQEVQLPRAVTVHCGHHRSPWGWVRDGIARLHRAYVEDQQPIRNMTRVSTKSDHALERATSLANQENKTASVFSLLWDHHSSQCVDDRDRVFALYGMISHAAQAKFDALKCCPVDYSKHFTWTYTQLAKADVKERLGLDILSHVMTFGSLAEQNSNWPSWVPAWNKTRKSQLALSMVKPSANPFISESAFRIVKHSAQTPMGVPVLRMDGVAHQITETPDINQAGGILEYFKRFLKSQYVEDEDAYRFYRNIIEFLLDISIKTSGSFYDRADFDFDSIFLMETRLYRGNKQGSTRSLLLDAVRAELDTLNFVKPVACFLNFSREALLHEIDRISEGHTVFFYQDRGRSIPSIAFAHVQPGDCVVRVSAVNDDNRGKFALVVRPHITQPGRDNSNAGYFRLVGCCVDCGCWLDEFKPSKKLNTSKEHETFHNRFRPEPLARTDIDIV